jgi:para-nitrobenzyl esterase
MGDHYPGEREPSPATGGARDQGPAARVQAVSETIVQTSGGALRGRATATGHLFGSIPYAAPPVGDLRFSRPQPAEPWSGTRDASAVGGTMPQPARSLPGLYSEPLLGRWDGSPPELLLNVWTPDPGGGALPVLVWLHGGAFVAGSPALYDGQTWTRDGVVLVTVSYRLGTEGFVWFDGGDPNVALQDQLAALRWVQEEIGAFGGDPGRVCLGGQSAGAMSLGLLLGSPLAGGLFSRAISMSGGVELTLSRAQGELVAAAVAARAGTAADAESMRAVPLERIIEAQGSIAPGELDLETAEDRDPGGGLVWLMPVRDGELVAEDPLGALDAASDVELLAGDTSEEGRLYLAGAPGFDELGAGSALAMATRMSADPEALVARLRAELPDPDEGSVAAAVLTDAAFHQPTARLLARHAQLAGPTHAYRFCWRSPALGGRLGAAHAVDLPFVFDNVGAAGFTGADDRLLGSGGAPAELANRMHAAWVRFVSGEGPGWPAYPHVEQLG